MTHPPAQPSQQGRRRRLGSPVAASWIALAAGLLLAACSSGIGEVGSLLGPPKHIPPAPQAPGTYPVVFDRPPPRPTTTLSEEQVKGAQTEMIEIRDRQSGRSKSSRPEP